MRQAKFAGTFYEKNEFALGKQLEECFLGKQGPGEMPSDKKSSKLKAVIVPHAGYQFSGPCAAWAFREVGQCETPDLFIIIGPSHHHNKSGISLDTFVTPMGFVRVHQDFAKKLLEKGTIRQNESIHEDEHSIEVQLPFLQFVFRDRLEKLKILPMLIGDDIDLKKLALDIKETLVDTGTRAVFIVSSDFTHYGPNYHYVPFSKDVKQNIYDLDAKMIDFIKNFDAKGFEKFVQDDFVTICGVKPIVLLLNIISSGKVTLEHYYTSGDVTSSYKNSVSYASILFK